MSRIGVLVLLLLAPGCLLGLGRASVASAPIGATRSTEFVVDSISPDGTTVRGHTESGREFRAGDLGVGAYAYYLPTLTVVSPSGMNGGVNLGWDYGVGGQVSLANVGLAVDVSQRYAAIEYAGKFGFGYRLTSPAFHLTWAPVGFLGLELGGGPLWGRAGAGGRGNVLDDSVMDLASGDASGFRASSRASLFLSAGGDLLMKSEIRVEAAYQRFSIASDRLPESVSTFTLGVGLALSFL